MSASAALEERTTTSPLLLKKLAAVLPKGYKFGIYHISTPPTLKDPLYAAPPNQEPDKTFCETQFLAITIDATAADGSTKPVLVLALEVFIYTTIYHTTLFISKADSTGYLHLLGLPKGTPSPIRTISGAFIEFLVETRRRRDVQFVVSLFARAQDQYLFPGSIENKKKHVLDDCGLVKWWARVVNPLLESPPPGPLETPWASTKGYLVVPGLDHYERRAFVPRIPSTSSMWSFEHPLSILTQFQSWDGASLPPRCLIPSYPDDPKCRFRDELDDEAHRTAAYKKQGSWRSVHNINQFWEMMAFRNECSSGRMTGFIWIVFDWENNKRRPTVVPKKQSKKDLIKKKKKKIKLTGVIKPREPRFKSDRKKNLLRKPVLTKYYKWPVDTRGEVLVDEIGYKQVYELLLRLNFSKQELAISSTVKWISEVCLGNKWGSVVEGEAETPILKGTDVPVVNSLPVNNLSGLVKRKRQDSEVKPAEPLVNMLTAVRKKPKV